MHKNIYVVFVIFTLFSLISCQESNWNTLPLINTTGPTVATTHWVGDWNADGSGAMLFSSVWNGRFYNSNFSAPFPEPDSGVYIIENIDRVLKGVENASITLLTGVLNWTTTFIGFPVGGLEDLEFPFRGFLASTGRFPQLRFFNIPGRPQILSVPGKIALVDVTNSRDAIVHVITPPNDSGDLCEYYYQTMKLYDINGDGLLDIVSIRTRDWVCTVPPTLLPGPTGFYNLTAEFIALLQPSDPQAKLQPWSLVVLYNFRDTGIVGLGVGGLFDFADLNDKKDSQPELIVANFFFPELAIYTLGKLNETWLTPGKQVNRVIVDNSLGGMYDVEIVDLNGDKDVEIVATTHTVRADNGIYAYEILDAFRNLTFTNSSVINLTGTNTRHALATNFSIFGRLPGAQRYRTGTFAVIPGKNKNRKPSLAVSTDGGGELVVISPNDEKKDNWNYTKTTLYQFGADVLDPIVYDSDYDGKYEISASVIAGDAIVSFEFVN